MNAKEIGRKAGRIFQNALPANWAFRSQEDQEDYGIDGEIELADESDHATGFIFKVQIKGQQSVSLINEGKTVSFTISCDKLQYYLKQIEYPIIFAVVDVTTENIYWRTLQDDPVLSRAIAEAISNKRSSLSIHLDANRTLTGKTEDMLVSVEQNMDWLRINAVKRISKPARDILKSHSEQTIEELLAQTKNLTFQLRIDKFQRLYSAKNYSELYNQARNILISPSESIRERFCSGMYLEKVHSHCHEFQSDEHRQANFELYLYLIGLARTHKTALQFKLLSILLMRSLRLRLFVEQDYHYYITSEQTKNDPLTNWVVATSRNMIAFRSAREVEKTVRLVNRFITKGLFLILPDILPRVAILISLYSQRLNKEGLKEQASFLIDWVEFGLDISLEVSSSLEEQTYFAGLIILKATLPHKSECMDNNLQECLTLADRIIDGEVKNDVVNRIDKIRDQKNTNNEELSPDDEIKYFKERAKALGINVDDPNDKFGKIIAQGLKDYNPERVLKNCKHLLYSPSSALGIPARMVGLPTAAMKFLHCLKKGFTVGGWSLDELYESSIPDFGFKSSHCKDCPDLEPMPEDWHWSRKWQHEMHLKHSELIKKIDSF